MAKVRPARVWWRPSTWFARERAALPESSRSYEGAGKGRRFSEWSTSSRSANVEIGSASRLLRERSRDLIRNNVYAAAAIRALVANLVGEGVKPRSATGDAALDATVSALWKRWAPKANAGPAPIGLYGLQALAIRSWLESGEVVLRRRRRRVEDGLAVPLQVQALEADQIDGGRNEATPNGGRIVQGVEFDPLDRPVAYHLLRVHPGESIVGLSDPTRATSRVLARDVAHLYSIERPGQVRGVPALTPAIRRFRDLDDYEDAELVRKKVEACLVGVVHSDEEEEEGVAGKVTDANGDVVETMEPGLFAYARGGKQIAFNQPHSTGGYEGFKRAELQSIAVAVGLTYELLSGDLSKVNFSSIRAGLIEFRRQIRMMRAHYVEPLLLAPIWRWFVEAAVAAGELPAPIDGDLVEAYPVKWAMPRFEEVDRKKDADADLAELKAGTTTLADLLARKGLDWLEVLAEHAAVKEEAERLGLKLDSLPFYGTKPAGEEEELAEEAEEGASEAEDGEEEAENDVSEEEEAEDGEEAA